MLEFGQLPSFGLRFNFIIGRTNLLFLKEGLSALCYSVLIN
jgi:hypothetical protein